MKQKKVGICGLLVKGEIGKIWQVPPYLPQGELLLETNSSPLCSLTPDQVYPKIDFSAIQPEGLFIPTDLNYKKLYKKEDFKPDLKSVIRSQAVFQQIWAVL